MPAPIAVEWAELRLDPSKFLAEVQRYTSTPVAVNVVVNGTQAQQQAKQQVAQVEAIVAKANTDVKLTVDTKEAQQHIAQVSNALADYVAELEFLDKQVKGEFSAGLALQGETLQSVAKAMTDSGISAEALAAELGVLTRAQEEERQAAARAANEAAEAERRRQEEFLRSPEYLAEVAAREAKLQAEREEAAARGAATLARLQAEAVAREAKKEADRIAAIEAGERAAAAAAEQAAQRKIEAAERVAATQAALDAESDARLARRAAERQAAGTTDLIGNAGLNLTSSADAAFARQAEEAEALVRVVQKLDVVLGELGTTFAKEIGLAGIKTADDLRAALEATGYSARELDLILGDDADALRQVGVELKDVDGKGLQRLRQGIGRAENVFGNMVGNFVQGAVRIQGALQPLGLFVGQLGDVIGEELFKGIQSGSAKVKDLVGVYQASRAAQAGADAAAAAAAEAHAIAQASEAAASASAATGSSYATVALQAKAVADAEAAVAAAANAVAMEGEAVAAQSLAASLWAAAAPYVAVAAGVLAVAGGLKLMYEWTRPEKVDDLTESEIKLGDALLASTRKLEENADALKGQGAGYDKLTPGAQAYAEAVRSATEDQTQFNALLAAQEKNKGVSGLIETKKQIDAIKLGTGDTTRAYKEFIDTLSKTDRAALEAGLGQKLDATKATQQVGALKQVLEDLPEDVVGATSALADAGGTLGRIADGVAYAASQYDKLRDAFSVSGNAAEKHAVQVVEAAIAAGTIEDDSQAAAEALINETVAYEQATRNALLLAEAQRAGAKAQADFDQALAEKGLGPKAAEYEKLQGIYTNLAKQVIAGVNVTDQQLARLAGTYGVTSDEIRANILSSIDEVRAAEEAAAEQAAQDAKDAAALEDEQDAKRRAAFKAATERYLEKAAQTASEREALRTQVEDQQALAAEVSNTAAQFGIVDDRINSLSPDNLETIKGKIEELSGAVDTWAAGLTNLSFGGVEDAVNKLFDGGKIPTVKQVLDANNKALAAGQKFSDLLQGYYADGEDETARFLQGIGEKYGTEVATKFAEQIEKGGPEAQAALATGLQFTDAAIAQEKAQWAAIGTSMGETIAPEIYNAIRLALEGEPYQPLIDIETEAQKAADEVERKFADAKLEPPVKPKVDTVEFQSYLNAHTYTVPVVPKAGGIVKYSFAGGDIAAGERSYVNELGLESFLRRGSNTPEALNLPAFGTFRAPTDGIILNHLQTREYLAAKAAGLRPTVETDSSGAPVLQANVPAAAAGRPGPTINASFTIVAPNPGQARQEVNAVLNGLIRRVS